ncbi:hypothetical protein Btru_052522 [Bulinus truncatus]|nr:hypothetical protein Btru_052522 [Bulinus truncatus]
MMSRHAGIGSPSDDDVEIQHTERAAGEEDCLTVSQPPPEDTSSFNGGNKINIHVKTVMPSLGENGSSNQPRSKEVIVNTDDRGQIGSNPPIRVKGGPPPENVPVMQASEEYLQIGPSPENVPVMQASEVLQIGPSPENVPVMQASEEDLQIGPSPENVPVMQASEEDLQIGPSPENVPVMQASEEDLQIGPSPENVPVMQASAEGQRFSTEEVDGDGDLSFRHLAANEIADENVSQRPRTHEESNQCSLTVNSLSFFNQQIVFQLKEIWKKLTVKVSLFMHGKVIFGTASLLSWKIWTDFKNHLCLKTLRHSQKPATAHLMVRVQNEFAAMLEIAEQVVVEFPIEKETFLVTSWARTGYQAEGSSSLVSESVPTKVCEHLESIYRTMCDLLTRLQQDPTLEDIFFIIGHCNGIEKKTVQTGMMKRCWEGRAVPDYNCLTVDESAGHFLSSKMNVCVEDCAKVLNKICPGDKSVYIIRFCGDLDRLKMRYSKS